MLKAYRRPRFFFPPTVSRRLYQEPPPLDRFAGVDRSTAERVKRGRYPVEAVLDLHGMTQAEAHRALSRVIAASRAAGQRCILVVTGHGRMSGGILKAAVSLDALSRKGNVGGFMGVRV